MLAAMRSMRRGAAVEGWGGVSSRLPVSFVLDVGNTGESHVGSADKPTATPSGAVFLLGGVVMVFSQSGRTAEARRLYSGGVADSSLLG